jgi:hypothetical protein
MMDGPGGSKTSLYTIWEDARVASLTIGETRNEIFAPERHIIQYELRPDVDHNVPVTRT